MNGRGQFSGIVWNVGIVFRKREKIRLNSVNEVLTNFKHLSISGEDGSSF
jgi:hypothetical protein